MGSNGRTILAYRELVYGAGQDYVIDDNNKIHLNETTYADEIASNSLGLMFVNVREF